MVNDDFILGQMKCPNCGRTRPTTLTRCGCGYNPRTHKVEDVSIHIDASNMDISEIQDIRELGKTDIPKYRIYKYELTGAVQQKVKLPKHSVVLRAADIQAGRIYLYARVNPLVKETEELEVGVMGTGWDIPDLPVYDINNHLCTVADHSRATTFVWHIFARTPRGTLKIANR